MVPLSSRLELNGGAVTRKWIDGFAPAALELIREPTEADVAAHNTRRKTALDLPDGMTSFAIEPAVAGAAVDARIGSFPVRPAVLRASGKMPNRYGIEVDRLTAIPGILSTSATGSWSWRACGPREITDARRREAGAGRRDASRLAPSHIAAIERRHRRCPMRAWRNW